MYLCTVITAAQNYVLSGCIFVSLGWEWVALFIAGGANWGLFIAHWTIYRLRWSTYLRPAGQSRKNQSVDSVQCSHTWDQYTPPALQSNRRLGPTIPLLYTFTTFATAQRLLHCTSFECVHIALFVCICLFSCPPLESQVDISNFVLFAIFTSSPLIL